VSLRVLKWSVAVDDQLHEIGAGKVAHVACQNGPDSVEVWTLELGGPHTLTAQVFATGQPLPGTVTHHIGSTVAADGLVWHVFGVSGR
jgi:hypothetical protein